MTESWYGTAGVSFFSADASVGASEVARLGATKLGATKPPARVSANVRRFIGKSSIVLGRMCACEFGTAGLVNWSEFHQLNPGQVRIKNVKLQFSIFTNLRVL